MTTSANGLNVNPVVMWIGGSNLTPCGNNSGFSELTNSNNVFIYPNPAKNSVELNFENEIEGGIIEFYDAIGRVMLKKNINNVSYIKLSVNELPEGFYLVKIITKEFLQTSNLIISR